MPRLCEAAGFRTRADFACDQPVDACGYIAADAVVHLRDAALAESDGWMGVALPNYSTLDTVRRGDAVLRRSATDRVLDVSDVNALVRDYAQLSANSQAHEEWWGGAIALDHFLEGALDDFLVALDAPGPSVHQWRAWVVNTQCSWQEGSHWFTVAIGVANVCRLAAEQPPEAGARSCGASASGIAEQARKRPAATPPSCGFSDRAIRPAARLRHNPLEQTRAGLLQSNLCHQ